MVKTSLTFGLRNGPALDLSRRKKSTRIVRDELDKKLLLLPSFALVALKKGCSDEEKAQVVVGDC